MKHSKDTMIIKIQCSSCKEEITLTTEPVLSLPQAREIIKSVGEVVGRHNKHTDDLDFWVYEKGDNANVKRFIYNTLLDKAK